MAARPNRPKHFIRPTESYFPLTNDFVDRILPTLNPSQAVVVLVLYRHTVGFWRDAVTMTQQQLAELSGLSLATVKRALTELRSGGWVDACTDMAGQPISWQVNWGDESEVAQNELPPQLKMSYPPAQNELPQADPVLIDSFLKESTKERDNPPTPLPEQNSPDMEQRIDHWAAAEARTHGVKLKVMTSTKKREALIEADCPELREQIAALIRTGSGDVTQDVLRLVGFGGRTRAPGGMDRQSFRPSYGPSKPTPKVDTALQESPLCREIAWCRNEAGIPARPGDFINMPQWKVAALDAMRLRDKEGFRERLTGKFLEYQPDYEQGVNTDAIVESFFESEQRHVRSERNSKTGDIREIIASLSA